MGSINRFFNNKKRVYILGLWSADGYHRTSSIGLTTIYPNLAIKFQSFLLEKFSKERLKLRIYLGRRKKVKTDWFFGEKINYCLGSKLKNSAYQIYVNSRPLLRFFRACVNERKELSKIFIPSFFAGRFDGDGSVSKDRKKDLRIAYSKKKETQIDRSLLSKLAFKKIKIYRYKKAGTYVLYISRFSTQSFLEMIQPESLKLQNLLITP